MKVYVPSAFTTTVPTFGMVAVCPAVNVPETPAIVNCVTVKASPSKSVSFVNTFPVAGVSSEVVLISSVAKGASFIGLTTMSIKPVSVPPLPSLTV